MRSIKPGSDCPRQLDGFLNSNYWDTVALPERFDTSLYEEKDWYRLYVKPVSDMKDGEIQYYTD
jgi:hypothetical protein